MATEAGRTSVTPSPPRALRILSIVGARPQFIKAGPVSSALRSRHHEILVHTGQHYDPRLSEVFFSELGIPAPDHHLGVGSGPHGRQTGRMLGAIEEVCVAEQPDWVLVYGDTNSTLAGALAAVKLGIPVAHVEAGLRSFNRSMPEEHNRILTDHCADLLLCSTPAEAEQLAREGVRATVEVVGDVMVDALRIHGAAARERDLEARWGVRSGAFCLATIHRPYNTDDPVRLAAILGALRDIGDPVLLPLHPRTRRRIAEHGLDVRDESEGLRFIEPVGYLDMLALEQGARLVLTDSGGVQKEAFCFGVPCVTLRPETEWTATVSSGWNVITDADPQRILAAANGQRWPTGRPPAVYGDGHAAERIVRAIEQAG